MKIIGIICEYNPFHNGHVYHIEKIKEKYPDSLIILCLSGYFTQRGDISILTKEEKVNIALDNKIDIVVELPFIFASESADTFAEAATVILNHMGVNTLIFGSECNNLELLEEIAIKQLDGSFNEKLKEVLKEGVNYPTALNKTIGKSINTPNDLLGVSYIKAIKKNNLNLNYECIKRTSEYHDTQSDNNIVSASNIREKFKKGIPIDKYINYNNEFKTTNEELLFNIIKYKIISESNLNKFLTVDEGIENKLIKEINNANNVEELILKVKSKRYTYNRIKRMLIHILVGLTKEDRNISYIEYIKILGFNEKGQKYLKKLKSNILISSKIPETFITRKYEIKASKIYDMLTSSDTFKYENSNKPIRK